MNRIAPRVAMALVAFQVIVVWSVLVTEPWRRPGEDFMSYYAATTVAAAGGSPYDLRSLRGIAVEQGWRGPVHDFLYPPTALPVFGWVTAFDFRPALLSWAVLMHVCMLATGALLAYTAPAERQRWGWTWIVVSTAAYSTYDLLWLGQATPLVLCATVATACLVHERRTAAAGLPLGLAIGIKLTPAILIPWLLWNRRYATVAVAVLTTAAMAGLAAILFPGADPARYFTEFLPSLAGTSQRTVPAIRMTGNLSFLKAFDWLGGSQGRDITETARSLALVAKVVVAAVAGVWVLRRPRVADDALTQFAVLVGVSQLLVDLFWAVSLVWVYPAATLLLVRRHELGRPARALAWVMLVVLAVPSTTMELLGPHLPRAAGLPFPLDLLKLFAVCIVLFLVARFSPTPPKLVTTQSDRTQMLWPSTSTQSAPAGGDASGG